MHSQTLTTACHSISTVSCVAWIGRGRHVVVDHALPIDCIEPTEVATGYVRYVRGDSLDLLQLVSAGFVDFLAQLTARPQLLTVLSVIGYRPTHGEEQGAEVLVHVHGTAGERVRQVQTQLPEG